MTPQEVLEQLKRGGQFQYVIGHPVAIGPADAKAAALLLWVAERWPEMKQGELDEVLVAALWWSNTFGAMHKALERDK